MFVRIHFDAASLFPVMVIMMSIAVTLKRLHRFSRQYSVALEWRYMKTFEFFMYKKMVNVNKLTKRAKKRAEEHYTEKKVPIIFGNKMYCFRNCEVKR